MLFPSDEWMSEWQRRLDESEEYDEIGSGWGVDFDGSILFMVDPDDTWDEEVRYYINFEDGSVPECHEVDDDVETGFRLRAQYSTWKSLLEGDLNLAYAFATNRIKFAGSLSKMRQYEDASVFIIDTAKEIPTEYV